MPGRAVPLSLLRRIAVEPVDQSSPNQRSVLHSKSGGGDRMGHVFADIELGNPPRPDLAAMRAYRRGPYAPRAEGLTGEQAPMLKRPLVVVK